MSIDPQARLVPSAHVVVRQLEDGAVLVDLRSGDCWELNKLGTEVWHLLDADRDLSQICDLVSSRHAVAHDVVLADVIALAETLSSARLVERRDA